ncbi:hypothetical protein ACQ4M3_05425 [Leptolyngbya sp. AN03gr2]|uniref:hypothetical protein n=1 Tax=unclassified Leptolyngbya TaxID=2650499 RepID=UPI003D312169
MFYAGVEAYAIVTGETIPDVMLSYPRSPMGKSWTAAEVVQRFPQVAQQYGVQKSMQDDE